MKMMNKLKNIQLIALDIDGTSMNSNSEITEYTRNVIQRLANKYVVVPTTGRGFYKLREKILKVENIRYVISANGAVVTDGLKNKRLFEFLIPYKVAAKIADKYTREDTFVYIHRNDEYSTHVFGCLNKEFYENNLKRDFKTDYKDLDIVDLYDYILKDQRNVLKIGIRFKSQCDLEIAKQNIERSFPEVNVFEVGNIGLEITEKLASKKDSLEKLCTYLNVDSLNVLAIGDNGNDVEMLKWAGVGVAMKNAVVQAKEVTNFICEDNDHDGAAHFLEEFLL
jgi:Cof subfamily protein (haloacid dehalogenase superfamily)